MRTFAALVLVAAVVHAPVSSADARENTRTTRLVPLEAAVVRELNRVRVARGLRPLRAAPSLGRAARTHTKAMLDFGFFSHDSVDGTGFSERVKRYYPSRGWRSWSAGEALLASPGQTEATGVVAAWMASPPHRELILKQSWRDVGVGALHAPVAPGAFANSETIAVTADFGLRSGK